MNPETWLRINPRWAKVPILLTDCSRFWDYKAQRKTAHKLCLAAMPYKEGHSLLHYVSEELGWDNLTLYNIPRTFATRAKGNIPDEQLKLLLGHCNTNLHVADNVYVSDHVPMIRQPLWQGRNCDRLRCF